MRAPDLVQPLVFAREHVDRRAGGRLNQARKADVVGVCMGQHQRADVGERDARPRQPVAQRRLVRRQAQPAVDQRPAACAIREEIDVGGAQREWQRH